MGKINFSDFFIYRKRYTIGYILVGLTLILTILFVGFYLPGGLSADEIQSVIHSSALNIYDFSTINIINLPYYILQKIGFSLFGVSILTIKLPSMILAFLSAIGLFLILKQWFKTNVAVLAALIAITTGQFLFIAQNGTPDVMFMFWPVCLLLLAGLIAHRENNRTLLATIFCVCIALSLYTPLGIYPILLFFIVSIIHPHSRYIIKTLPKKYFIPGIIIGAGLLVPLIVAIINKPDTLLALLGIPTTSFDLLANLSSLFAQYFGFFEPGGTTAITPFFELCSMIIIIIGLIRIIQVRSMAKSYIVALWIILLIPIIILNPNYTNSSFLPLTILLAAGVGLILNYWYKLFPRNPYARLAGLIPIIILISTLTLSGLGRYVYSYRYNPVLVNSFNRDIKLIPKDTRDLVVSDNELAFYQVLQKYNNNFNVSLNSSADSFLATHQANQEFSGYQIDKIITSSQSNDSDRFYLYKKVTN